MRKISNAITSSLLLAALALAGCGDGSPSTAAPGTSIGQQIALESPVMAGTHAIPPRYTCDGKNISLPLRWGSVPAGTRELALLVLSLKPVRTTGSGVVERASVLWAVTGLRPTLRRLAPGRLPRGAILGRNSGGHSGYSICPAEGTSQNYLIALFASPRRLSARPGFSDESLFIKLRRTRAPFGQLFAGYSRA
jgi:phosphatidylethanolamine-binding protein (PEBP) family uncharacterized protein